MSSPEDKLERLDRARALHEGGLITAEELAEAEARIRAEPAPSASPPTAPASQGSAERYPMRFEVDYPGRLSRLSTLFRAFLLIPAFFVSIAAGFAIFVAFIAGWFMVFFTRRYPRWAFRWASWALGYSARVWAYATLISDRFPSLHSEGSPVHLDYDEPPNGQLSRWRAFWWKAFLLSVQYVVLNFLYLGLYAVTVMSWFAILFTGHFPRGMFAFVVGVLRWQFRIQGYFASFNDRFPPYSLSPEAGPASNRTVVLSGFGGLGYSAVQMVWAVAALFAFGAWSELFQGETVDVDYAALQRGVPSEPYVYEGYEVGTMTVTLVRVYDPGDAVVPVAHGTSERVVVFEWRLISREFGDQTIDKDDARVTVDEGGNSSKLEADTLTVDGRDSPAAVRRNTRATVRAAFFIPADATVTELRFDPGFAPFGGLTYRFE